MIDTLVFSGGGINAFYFIGALETLINKKKINLEKIKHLLGCSVGSIIAFILNLNYSIYFIKKLIINLDFLNLLEIEDDISDFDKLLNKNGLFSIINIKKILTQILYEKYKVKKITFKELYKKTKKNLVIKVYNYTLKKEQHINYKTNPNYSVIDMICASSSIPFFFKMYKYNKYYYIDGGIKNNFPDYSNKLYKNNLVICCKKNNNNNNKKNKNDLVTFIFDIIEIANYINLKCSKNILVIPTNNSSNFINFNIKKKYKLEMLNFSSNFTNKFINDYLS
jgi:predicted acylesterase/phospholipase RssA